MIRISLYSSSLIPIVPYSEDNGLELLYACGIL